MLLSLLMSVWSALFLGASMAFWVCEHHNLSRGWNCVTGAVVAATFCAAVVFLSTIAEFVRLAEN